MSLDSVSNAVGIVGIAASLGVFLWGRKARLEERCDFLRDVSRDLAEAFDVAERVIGDIRTPAPIRKLLLRLVAAHAREDFGRSFALAVFADDGTRVSEEDIDDNPISIAMRRLAVEAPSLQRDAHRASMTLTFGLMVVYFGDQLEVSRVEMEAARDPLTFLSRIGRLFGTPEVHSVGTATVPVRVS